MSHKVKVTRFSVSVPQPLIEDLDRAWKTMGYENRSKAVHDAIRTFISEFAWMQKETGQITGALLILYYLKKPGLLEEIMDAQHKFKNVVLSTMHIHLEEEKCLEIIALRGIAQEVKNLAKVLMTKKGVKQVKVAAMAP